MFSSQNYNLGVSILVSSQLITVFIYLEVGIIYPLITEGIIITSLSIYYFVKNEVELLKLKQEYLSVKLSFSFKLYAISLLQIGQIPSKMKKVSCF